MARRGDWEDIRPGFRVRQLPDGQWQGQLAEDVSASLNANAEMRKHVKGRIAKETEAKETDLRIIASMPETLYAEMHRECGQDPDSIKRFLHDHPEVLVIPKNSAPTKARKGYSSPHHKRRG